MPDGLLNSSNWQFTMVGPVKELPEGPDSCTLPTPKRAGSKFNPPLPEILPEKFILWPEKVASTGMTLKSARRFTGPAQEHSLMAVREEAAEFTYKGSAPIATPCSTRLPPSSSTPEVGTAAPKAVAVR